MTADLFSPVKLGAISLKNRIVMAPLTRNRAGEGGVPHGLNVTYYVQRATAGLIITEATPISYMAHGYPALPGIYTDAQVAGWKKVTDAVHAKGSKIVSQIWHVGRISHPSLLNVLCQSRHRPLNLRVKPLLTMAWLITLSRAL